MGCIIQTGRSYRANKEMGLIFYKQVAPTEQKITRENYYFRIGQNCSLSEEEINQLVYELYNLTEKEIKIIEGGANE